MDELLIALFASASVMVGTGVTAVFKGREVLEWIRRKETAVKKAHLANAKGVRAKAAKPRARA